VWQNDATSSTTVHYYGGINGAVLQGWNWLNKSGAAGWHVKMAVDFNGDGYPDLTRHSRNQTGKLVTMPEWASNY
jgi:hypothetical protein